MGTDAATKGQVLIQDNAAFRAPNLGRNRRLAPRLFFSGYLRAAQRKMQAQWHLHWVGVLKRLDPGVSMTDAADYTVDTFWKGYAVSLPIVSEVAVTGVPVD